MNRRSLQWLVTGAGGMVGKDLVDLLRREGDQVVALTRSELDITDREAVLAAVSGARPDVIVNCAAWTAVDDCETDPARAELVNGTAVGHLADAAGRVDALLTQISTDFVFDGTAPRPYLPGDPVAPLSVYGGSKLLGEQQARRAPKHLVVRTSWLFGPAGPSFPHAIRRQIDGGKSELRVVNDQRGRPTWTPHLVEAIVALSRLAAEDPGARGIVHYADQPECTWFDLAVEIATILRPDGSVAVLPVSSAEFSRPARRPGYSVLSTDRYETLTGRKPKRWRDGLEILLG